MLNGRGGRKAVWLKWERGCMVEAGVYAEWPRWACGCVAEVGEWLYGRGGRVAVQLRWALQWFGEELPWKLNTQCLSHSGGKASRVNALPGGSVVV